MLRSSLIVAVAAPVAVVAIAVAVAVAVAGCDRPHGACEWHPGSTPAGRLHCRDDLGPQGCAEGTPGAKFTRNATCPQRGYHCEATAAFGAWRSQNADGTCPEGSTEAR